ncbi:hypothetical protein NE237_002555 [Protea cynaroides]|uniref:O-methyltransferase C-terminal domain-containing protein n=1 Tax=Protea cynaroides TaxID=273540 RepID=A0A9Q0KVM5_9MAGN|nr:hypothetical protein NE237_002555 [Protea cynaroides]
MATGIRSPSPNIDYLARVMKLLVHKRIFTTSQPTADDEEVVYDLTNSSRWLLKDSSEPSLAEMVLAENHPILTAPWHYLSKCVGGEAFTKAHGYHIWDFVAANREFNLLFSDHLACTSNVVLKAGSSAYREGFVAMGSRSMVVDVGGRTGMALAEIVKNHPHI